MLEPKVIAENWKKVVQIYNENRDNGTNHPDDCIKEVIKAIGLNDTIETFATIAALKKDDGRIYGRNREWINYVEVNPEAAEYKRGNAVIYAGLDSIHTTHINNLITCLREESQR